MDVSTMRQWVVRFSNSNSAVKDKPHSRQAMKIFMSAECRLLFIGGKNAELMVVTIVEKQCFVAEDLLYQTVLLYSFICCFHGNIDSGATHIYAVQDNLYSLNAVQASQKVGHLYLGWNSITHNSQILICFCTL